MTPGRLIAVVGPSGVGKDTVMAGIKAAMPNLHVVRRVTTREIGLGGEDYYSVSVAEFQKMAATGAFVVHWGAHDMFYGIPNSVCELIESGTDCLANFSRGALAEAAMHFDRLIVLNLTAEREVLAKRLSARARETKDDIERRLSRSHMPLPEGLNVLELSNNGALEFTIEQAVALLQPVRS